MSALTLGLDPAARSVVSAERKGSLEPAALRQFDVTVFDPMIEERNVERIQLSD
jgi:hypothetical protein